MPPPTQAIADILKQKFPEEYEEATKAALVEVDLQSSGGEGGTDEEEEDKDGAEDGFLEEDGEAEEGLSQWVVESESSSEQ